MRTVSIVGSCERSLNDSVAVRRDILALQADGSFRDGPTATRYRLADMRLEEICLDVPHDAVLGSFPTVRAEEQDGWWSEQAESFEQGLVSRVVGGDVST